MFLRFLAVTAFALSASVVFADAVKVGSGSYSDSFPGTDEAGRNGFINSAAQVSGKAVGRPVPTNDWWSNELVSNHGNSMFNYPLGIRTQDDGVALIRNAAQQAIMHGDGPLVVGLKGMSVPVTKVSDFSDWTVTFDWNGMMSAIVAQGSPFVYFTRSGSADVELRASGTMTVLDGNILLVTGGFNQASYAVYAPGGATWQISGNRATSDLGGKGYFSAVLLPEGADASTTASEWRKYAFVFPADTRADFSCDKGVVTTTYSVITDVKEGTDNRFLLGLLPHHWGNLASTPAWEKGVYSTVRGELRMAGGNEFKTRLEFHGILPTLPAVSGSSHGFSQAELERLIDKVTSDHGLVDWTDSYNDGMLLNRLVQVGRIAKESGYEAGFRKVFDLVKARVERWLTYKPGDKAFMFYYHKDWSAMLGYPAGHGQDTNINDHHFHWGYLIHAAAFIEQYQPGWKESWGGMIDLLVRDAASSDRNDSMFPYLRNFSPYAGHSWANGTASLGLGNDQESTSESIQFACSLIHWGELTGRADLRDLGVYLYVTERSAIEEYWFDIHDRNFADGYKSAVASRVFTNGYDDQNFWGGGIAGSYGIQIYPVHAGSAYLVRDKAFAERFWKAMSTETAILRNEANDNIWYDAWARFLAMTDPAAALQFYKDCTQLGKKFGDSQAHTYQWIHALSEIGTPDCTVTASSPFAMVFDNGGVRTYVAQNYGSAPQKIDFSDGYSLTVPARTLYSSANGDPQPQAPSAVITADPERGKVGENVTLTATVVSGDYTIESVTLKVDGEALATTAGSESGVYTAVWTPSAKGTYTIVASVATTEGRSFESGALSLTVDGDDDPVADDPTETTVTFTADQASQGELHGGGYLRFSYDGKDVTVVAHFDGEYTGAAGPWLWNYTDGFAETQMSPYGTDEYSAVLTGYTPGQTIRVAAKIAYTGGMGVTPICEFAIPKPDSSAMLAESELSFAVYPNPASEIITVSGAGEMSIVTMAGTTVARRTIDGTSRIDISALDRGFYLVTLRSSHDGQRHTVKLIKR